MQFKKFGKYTIIKKLASGGMADILLASELSPTGFGRFVVIKRALSKFSENEEFKDMFKNEGKVACNLKHRNITPIYEFGIENNQFFLSMEYISGRNLREFIKRLQAYKNPPGLPNIIHIIKEVAAGLNYAHNAIDSNTGQPLNLIHRDVSPQNIMLSFDGEVKLIDFGIAKIADTNLTRAGHLKGKFSYMSPEQAHGETLDERTDIFCLGILFWELLANKRLFASTNEMATLKKVKNCDVPNVQKINPQVPTELNDIVKKALSKNKNSRYKTAAKLEQDLSVFLNKNYPEYSHYDFISLIKQAYRKKIMEERERLKSYSSKFKKYINTLNVEESLSSRSIDFNLPDLSTFVKESESTTKSLQINKEDPSGDTQNISDYVSSFSNPAKDDLPSAKAESQITEKNRTTLVQKADKSTQTGQKKTETKKEPTKTNPIQQILHAEKSGAIDLTAKTSLGLVKDPKSFFESTQSTFSTNDASLYYSNENDFLERTIKKANKSKSLLILLSLTVFLAGFSAIVYLLMNEKDIITLIKNPKALKTSSTKPNKKISSSSFAKTPVLKTNQASSFSKKEPIIVNRKVFIHSKPSGAAIFINNKFSSKYTPSLVTLTTNKSLNITIKKEGYLSKNFILDPTKQKNNSLNIILNVDHQRNIASEKIQIIQ